MTPNQRQRGRKDLPDYLNPQIRTLTSEEKKTYYYYNPPWLSKAVPFGIDKETAIKAAEYLNRQHRTNTEQKLINKVTGGETFNDFLSVFEEDILPTLTLAKKTKQEHGYKMPHIRAGLGVFPPLEISLQRINQFLDQFPATQSNRYRSLLCLIWKHAISRGIKFEALPGKTLPKPENVTVERLSIEAFWAIYRHAPMHIKNCMDLGVQTLLRREDLANLKVKNWDKKAETLTVIPLKQKTKSKTKNGIIFKVDKHLKAILDRCISDQNKILSPWLIHQSAKANKARRGKKLEPASLSRGFKKARDKSGYYENSEHPPGLHGLRSFGAAKYLETGKTREKVGRILGHSTGSVSRMTLRYLDGYNTHFDTVEVGLDLTLCEHKSGEFSGS